MTCSKVPWPASKGTRVPAPDRQQDFCSNQLCCYSTFSHELSQRPGFSSPIYPQRRIQVACPHGTSLWPGLWIVEPAQIQAPLLQTPTIWPHLPSPPLPRVSQQGAKLVPSSARITIHLFLSHFFHTPDFILLFLVHWFIHLIYAYLVNLIQCM